jgi:uncharacterized protein YeaO (DUF488 family)
MIRLRRPRRHPTRSVRRSLRSFALPPFAAEFCTWFGHDPNRLREFQKRYFGELRANHAAVDHLTDLLSAGKVTLLFGAHDIEHHNAVALADYLAEN